MSGTANSCSFKRKYFTRFGCAGCGCGIQRSTWVIFTELHTYIPARLFAGCVVSSGVLYSMLQSMQERSTATDGRLQPGSDPDRLTVSERVSASLACTQLHPQNSPTQGDTICLTERKETQSETADFVTSSSCFDTCTKILRGMDPHFLRKGKDRNGIDVEVFFLDTSNLVGIPTSRC